MVSRRAMVAERANGVHAGSDVGRDIGIDVCR